MAEPQERGQFILDLDVTSSGHLFLSCKKTALMVHGWGLGGQGLGGQGLGGTGAERVWKDRGESCQGLTVRVTLSLSALTL